MIGRELQKSEMQRMLKLTKSYFVIVSGRRRIGKTYLIDEQYSNHYCFSLTGIQNADMDMQITNFTQKLAEYSDIPIVTRPNNWQEAFILFKTYLQRLPKNKKQVIFLDELPWIATLRSSFIQLLAHLWNDYLSKHKHFILVVSGSATSWIAQKLIADKGGFHNRKSVQFTLEPFTLAESKKFLHSRGIKMNDESLTDIYMAMGGVPYYLENIRKGESAATTIGRMCFAQDGILKNEYDNLYKALFNNPENHEAIVEVLAKSKNGLTRSEIIKKSKVSAGGPYTRAMYDLVESKFIVEETPYGKKKRGATYRLVDEYSIFFHRFIKPNKKANKGIWMILSNSQKYKTWAGFAFENICLRHIKEIKKTLGIGNVYTENSSYRHTSDNTKEGFQIDLIIDRTDKTINLCECKYHNAPFAVTKKYGEELDRRKMKFRSESKTSKQIFTTLITNKPLEVNEHSLAYIDSHVLLKDLIR